LLKSIADHFRPLIGIIIDNNDTNPGAAREISNISLDRREKTLQRLVPTTSAGDDKYSGGHGHLTLHVTMFLVGDQRSAVALATIGEPSRSSARPTNPRQLYRTFKTVPIIWPQRLALFNLLDNSRILQFKPNGMI
jgi:hypothetical protein